MRPQTPNVFFIFEIVLELNDSSFYLVDFSKALHDGRILLEPRVCVQKSHTIHYIGYFCTFGAFV